MLDTSRDTQLGECGEVGLRIIWVAALPVALIYALGAELQRIFLFWRKP